MSRTLRFDDLAGFNELATAGFGKWGEPVEIDAGKAECFERVTGVPSKNGQLPGCLLQSLLPRLMPPPAWDIEGYSGAINLGAPRTRFPQPAPIGAQVQGRSRLADAISHPKGTVVSIEFELRETGANEPCLQSLIEVLYLGGRV